MSLQSYECLVNGKRYCVTYRNGEAYCVDVSRGNPESVTEGGLCDRSQVSYSHLVTTWSTLVKIKLPATMGEEIKIAAHGHILSVKKLRTDFFAHIESVDLGRFGNAEQIREDIEYFMVAGSLPKSKISWA